MADVVKYRFVWRGRTAANWTALNEVLLEKEAGIELDTMPRKWKIGDGVTPWNDLPYQSGIDIDDTNIGDGRVLVWNAAGNTHEYADAVRTVTPGVNLSVDDTDPQNIVIDSLLGPIQLKGRVANYAALPSVGNTAGDAYFNDADKLIYIWDGSSWPSNGAGFSAGGTGETPPKIADFTSTQGAGGATFTDRLDRLDVSIPQTVFMHALYKALASPPYTIDAHISLDVLQVSGTDAIALGLGLTDGTKTRGYYMGYWGSSTSTDKLSIDSWTNNTTFGSQISFQTPFKHFVVKNHWIRITDDGTTRRFWLSSDGKKFFQFYSEATNTFVTPTKIGLLAHNINTSGSTPGKGSVFNFKVTPSILGDAS